MTECRQGQELQIDARSKAELKAEVYSHRHSAERLAATHDIVKEESEPTPDQRSYWTGSRGETPLVPAAKREVVEVSVSSRVAPRSNCQAARTLFAGQAHLHVPAGSRSSSICLWTRHPAFEPSGCANSEALRTSARGEDEAKEAKR